MANEVIPYYEPGSHLTGRPTANVIGMRFAAIDADAPAWQPEGLKASPTDGNVVPVRLAGAGEEVIGVFQRDVAAGEGKFVTVMRQANMVLPVRAGAAITAGTPVESGADGRAVPAGTGSRVGVAWSTTTAADQIVAVELD